MVADILVFEVIILHNEKKKSSKTQQAVVVHVRFEIAQRLSHCFEETVYFNLALIFLLFRFSFRIRFSLHLAFIVVLLSLAVARQ